MASLTRFLEKKRRLTVNPQKSKVAPLSVSAWANCSSGGVSERQAVLTALSRKSYWHLSRTMPTQWGLNAAWLKSQGSENVRE